MGPRGPSSGSEADLGCAPQTQHNLGGFFQAKNIKEPCFCRSSVETEAKLCLLHIQSDTIPVIILWVKERCDSIFIKCQKIGDNIIVAQKVNLCSVTK